MHILNILQFREECESGDRSSSIGKFPPHPIPLGHPSAPAPSTLSHALNLDC